MKQLFLLLFTFSQIAFGQENFLNEDPAPVPQKKFKIYKNGLIYSPKAMKKLRRKARSLNSKYKTYDLNNTFYAKKQTIGHIISLDSGNIQQAKLDIQNKIPFEDFVKKYHQAHIEKNQLILKWKYKTYSKEDRISFNAFDLNDDEGLGISSADLSLYESDMQNKWAFEHHEKPNYSKESLHAFYFPNKFTSEKIPHKYALMIGYADFLIDTSTTELKKDFESYSPEPPQNWTSLSHKSKVKLLDTMRRTMIISQCGQDPGPWDHAVNIAVLSAETYNWSVFLRAHLDIMDNRFERDTSSNYAWGTRNTYIRELEQLDINLLDLISGIMFRIENPATNHYSGYTNLIGKALAETKNLKAVEDQILSTISDKELDLYNRLFFYFLFKNYNTYVKEEKQKKLNEEKLKLATNTLPDYLKNGLIQKE